MMKPTVGRIVHYALTAEEAKAMNARRKDTQNNLEKMRKERPGYQAHVGTTLTEGQIVPLTVTSVSDAGREDEAGVAQFYARGQATLEGSDSLFVNGALGPFEYPASEPVAPLPPGQWRWPPRV